jgi:hypothetical protein
MKRALRIAICFWSTMYAAEPQWRWAKLQNNFETGWDMSKGVADVAIKDGRIVAKLYLDGSDGHVVQISLSGAVAGGVVTVKETIYNSDFSGSTYGGKLTVRRSALPSGGVQETEVITLSDGFGMIGLTRHRTK